MHLDDIKYLLSPAADSLLAKNSNFSYYLNYALSIINDVTGSNFQATDEFTAAMQWLKTPLAWIIEYLVARKVSGGSDDYWRQCSDNFQHALKILGEHKIQKNRQSAKPVLGKIENIYGEL